MTDDALYATVVEMETESLLIVCHDNKPYLRYIKHENIAVPLGLEGHLIREAFWGILAELEIPQDTSLCLITDKHHYFGTTEFINMVRQAGIEIMNSHPIYKPTILRLAPDPNNTRSSSSMRPEPQLDQGDSEPQSETDMVLEQAAQYFENSASTLRS